MPFRVKRAVALKTEADRIQAILLTPSRIRVTWTQESLQAELLRIGLEYSNAEIAALNDELHTRGIVEDTV